MRVAITGVAGYVGSVVTSELLARGHEVRSLDSLMYGGDALLGIFSYPKFSFLRGDVRDVATVSAFIRDAEAVVHLAALVGDPACARVPDIARRVNHEASMALINAASGSGVERFVFISTCSNYGRMLDGDGFVDEQSPLHPLSVYAETKVAVERHLLDNRWPAHFAPTVLRLATVHGMSFRPRFDLTVNEFTAELFVHRNLTVYGEKFWRPYVHVRDVARAVAAALEAPVEVVRGEVFNVGSTAENFQKQQLVEKIIQRVPDARLQYVHQTDDPRDYRVRFDKIRAALNFTVEHSVETGIDEVLLALREGVVADPFQSRFRN